MSTHVLLEQFSILIFFSIENYSNNLFSSSIHDQNSGNNDKSFDLYSETRSLWVNKYRYMYKNRRKSHR